MERRGSGKKNPFRQPRARTENRGNTAEAFVHHNSIFYSDRTSKFRQQISMGGSQRIRNDLLHYCILPRLPTKALLRLQCVSRSWHTLISSDPYFIHLHYSQRIPSSYLCMDSICTIRNQGFVSEEEDTRSFGIPRLAFNIYVDTSDLVALSNGLVCLRCTHKNVRKLFIGNPVLRDWRPLPHPESINYRSSLFGLAVEVEKSAISYKVVMLETSGSDNDIEPIEFMFYTLSSTKGKWEVAKKRSILSHGPWKPWEEAAADVNGVLYWTGRHHLLWFDTKDEDSGFFPLPPGSNKKNCHSGMMGECNGVLTYSRMMRGQIEIWSMVQPSWKKMHSINFNKIIRWNPDVFNHFTGRWWRKSYNIPVPLAFEGSDIVFVYICGVVFSFNMKTGEAKQRFTGVVTPDWFSYKNCLVPTPAMPG